MLAGLKIKGIIVYSFSVKGGFTHGNIYRALGLDQYTYITRSRDIEHYINIVGKMLDHTKKYTVIFISDTNCAKSFYSINFSQ